MAEFADSFLVANDGTRFPMSMLLLHNISTKFAVIKPDDMENGTDFVIPCSANTLGVIIDYYLHKKITHIFDMIELYSISKEYRFCSIADVAYEALISLYARMEIAGKIYVIQEMILREDVRILELIETWMVTVNTLDVAVMVIDMLNFTIEKFDQFSSIPATISIFVLNPAYCGYLNKIAILMAICGQTGFIRLLKEIPGDCKSGIKSLLAYAELDMGLRSGQDISEEQKDKLRQFVQQKFMSKKLPVAPALQPPKISKRKRHLARTHGRTVPIRKFWETQDDPEVSFNIDIDSDPRPE